MGKPGIQRSLERRLNKLLHPLGTTRGQRRNAVAQRGITVQPALHHIRSAPHIPGKFAGKRHLSAKKPQRLKQALAAQPLHQNLRAPGYSAPYEGFQRGNALGAQLLHPVVGDGRKRSHAARSQEKGSLGSHSPQPVKLAANPPGPIRGLGNLRLHRPDLGNHLILIRGQNAVHLLPLAIAHHGSKTLTCRLPLNRIPLTHISQKQLLKQ